MTVDTYLDCAVAGWQLLILALCAGLGLFALAGWRRARTLRCGRCANWVRLAQRLPWHQTATGICGAHDCERSETAVACQEWRASE